ncbi:MAG: helix-turn-helix domain-containing protein [Chloroflexi bacterium]|nr:helix-turn-helix domain-containing protein [Chloroflexota bacterium]
MMALAPVRSDTLPENSTYRDDGCDVSPTCLDCPLPVCKYDDPDFLRRTARSARDRAILATRKVEGLSVPALAARFGVSTRTVHRVLQSERLGSFRPIVARPAFHFVPRNPARSFRIPAPLPEIWPAAS